MQEKKTVLAFVFDGFADWEGAYVCAELNRELNGEPSPYTTLPVRCADMRPAGTWGLSRMVSVTWPKGPEALRPRT